MEPDTKTQIQEGLNHAPPIGAAQPASASTPSPQDITSVPVRNDDEDPPSVAALPQRASSQFSAPDPYIPTRTDSEETAVMKITEQTLAFLKKTGKIQTMSLREISDFIVCQCKEQISRSNDVLAGTDAKYHKKRPPRSITPFQMAMITLATKTVRSVGCAGLDGDASYDTLGIYQEKGDSRGLYDCTEIQFRMMAREMKLAYTKPEFEEYISALRDLAERVEPYSGGRFIACNNGYVDYEDTHRPKRLYPFSPDIVFLSKSRVNYNPNAKLSIIHNNEDGTDWDVESFILDLVNSPEMSHLLWEVLGAAIRPGGTKAPGAWAGFQKCVLLTSPTGCNGKGTFCQLLRNLCGPGTTASIPMDKLGDNFILEQLIGKIAVITDESNVGGYLDQCANLKSLVTHDPVQINRKYRTPVTYVFRGLMVFCVNDTSLRVKDKSGSFLRRMLCVPFEKLFQGVERTYIKDDYINRPEVLEYVLNKVINMDNYYKLSEPQECKALLADMSLQNDPVRQFVDEILPQCRWDLLPFGFLHDLYVAYFKRTNPSGSPLGKMGFISSLQELLRDSTEWEFPSKGKNGQYPQYSSFYWIVDKEPLIGEYDLIKWPRTLEHGAWDPRESCPLKRAYRGIRRRNPQNTYLQQHLAGQNS